MRPQRFSEVVGQKKVIQTLVNAMEMKRLGHAYLFSGPHGTGKTTLARLFSKALNCDQLHASEPCNQCTSCLEITSCRSMDVIEIDGASNRGIDDIRQINETVSFAPQKGKYKIYIIDEVHMLTKEAFNALLKTLEDPPSRVKFFFATTELHKMPDTILSRCQCFHLRPISLEEVQKHLVVCSKKQNINLDEKAAQLIAERTSGSLRDALVLTDQLISYSGAQVTADHVHQFLGLLPTQELFELDHCIQSSDVKGCLEFSQKLFQSGAPYPSFLESLADHYRTLLYIIAFGQKPDCLSLSDEHWPEYEKIAKGYTYDQCLHLIDLILDAQLNLKTVLSKKTAMEQLILEMARSSRRICPHSLIDRIHKLQQGAPPSPSPQPSQPIHNTSSKPTQQTPPPVKKATKTDSKKDLPKKPPVSKDAKKETNRYNNLMQFAAVELEGSLKKEG